MLRPNEINEKTFSKVGDGVYSAAEVDEFMRQVSSSYEQVFKQNGELVRRMSILANRLEAYRRQEEQAKAQAEKNPDEEFNESLKNKLEQAKAVAQKMLDDAKARAVAIVKNANAESDKILVDLKDKIQEQKVTLDLMNEQSEAFKKKLIDTYRQHLLIIDSIPTEAEKIVKDNPQKQDDAAASADTEKYVVESDDSDIFAQADEFAEKLDEPEEETVGEVSFEAEAAAEDAPVIEKADESADAFELIDEEADDEDGVKEFNEVSDETEPEDDPFFVDESEETVAQAETEDEKTDDGFVFDFSEISFDDDDDDEDYSDEDEEPSESEVVFESSDANKEDIFSEAVEETNDEANPTSDVFSFDDGETDALSDDDSVDTYLFNDETESEEKSDKGKHLSLKDIIMAKLNDEKTETDAADFDETVSESEDGEN